MLNDSITKPDTKPDRYSHPGKAGRRPKASTLVSRALALVDKRLPEIFEALIQKAIDGDRDAQIYLIDRRLGKPKQTTEIEGGEKMGAGMVAQFFNLLQAEQERRRLETTPLLTEGDKQPYEKGVEQPNIHSAPQT